MARCWPPDHAPPPGDSRVQPSAGPDLPHTRSRAGHWLATAAALAAAIGAGTLVPHSDASATATVTEPSGDVTPGAPDPTAAHFPLQCAGAPVDVVSQASGDLDGD